MSNPIVYNGVYFQSGFGADLTKEQFITQFSGNWEQLTDQNLAEVYDLLHEHDTEKGKQPKNKVGVK